MKVFPGGHFIGFREGGTLSAAVLVDYEQKKRPERGVVRETALWLYELFLAVMSNEITHHWHVNFERCWDRSESR
jgi:hypothetical protein